VIPADDARREGLRLAVDLYADRRSTDLMGQVTEAAREFAFILLGRPASLALGDPSITEAATGRPVSLHRTGVNMAVTITDTQIADYSGQVAEKDTKGFPVSDALTWAEDSAGAVVSGDGAGKFTAVAPGTANITVSDGTLTASDAITVDAGAAASLLLGAPVVTEQA
jgi:hypothetical protein